MASRANRYTNESSASGNSSTSHERFCHCGMRALLKVSNSVANPGREYYTCPARRCGYFTWAGAGSQGTARIRGQRHEAFPEEHRAGADINLQERVAKIENECVRLKMIACMNVVGDGPKLMGTPSRKLGNLDLVVDTDIHTHRLGSAVRLGRDVKTTKHLLNFIRVPPNPLAWNERIEHALGVPDNLTR
ncbi:hypothetical protein PIB30_015106 [Stylosanthes scabra]|uniref:GRF-type domain-containing protein n=1 Tax=Stylosanthes scabra TaxID=79078 RepID=A0ABU6R771_9FABA|nr:hypothetical protein [Stylosanthes scabra]